MLNVMGDNAVLVADTGGAASGAEKTCWLKAERKTILKMKTLERVRIPIF
jgi:hypothetical protein